MSKIKKNRTPLYKQFITLRENVQNRKKLLKFKRLKWKQLILNYEKKLKRYKKFKPQDHNKYLVSKYPSKSTSYKKRYRNTLQSNKRFRLFYGGLPKRYLKKLLLFLSHKNKNLTMLLLETLERRLDVVLYRAKFGHSIQSARQLIAHGKILVNQKVAKSKSTFLKTGDFISVKNDISRLVVESNIKQANTWPIPPKHLQINYKTMQIIFGKHENINLSQYFPFSLNLEQIVNNKQF